MLTIRHFNPTDTEYEESYRIQNLEWPEEPETALYAMWQDQNRDKKYFFQRFVAELDGKMIAAGTYREPTWSYKPGKFHLFWNVDPAYANYTEAGLSIHQLILDYILEQLSTRNPKILDTDMREDKLKRVQILLDNGFEFQMRAPHSALKIADFDFAAYAELPAKIAQKGIQIRTLAELMQSDPDWMNKAYELCWELDQDVPSTDPITKRSLEEWKKDLDAPNFLAEGWFIAIDGSDYVGITMLAPDNARDDMMHTGLTGTVRSHRRKGIATALKLRSIELAKSRGAKVIDTFNEENNPMYDLNVQLGFKAQAAWADYRKLL